MNNSQSVELTFRAAKEDLARDTLDGLIYSLLDVSPYPDLQNELPIAEKDYIIEIQVDEL